MKRRFFLLAVFLLLLSVVVYAQSNGPTLQKQNPTSYKDANTATHQQSAANLMQTLPIVPTTQTPKDCAATNTNHQKDNQQTGWWIVKLTAILAIVAFLQFVALVIQSIVMGVQAKRLRETVEATERLWKTAEDQSEKMRKYIAEAVRTADAMQAVAESSKTNVITSQGIAERQERFGKMQLRAYLSTDLRAESPQRRSISWPETVLMNITNLGNTPARESKFFMKAAIMDFPLPDDFDLSLTPPVGEGADINPKQVRFISAALSDLIPDDKMRQIKQDVSPKLYVWGTVWYKDVFGESHETHFCHICQWDVKDVMSILNYTRHNKGT